VGARRRAERGETHPASLIDRATKILSARDRPAEFEAIVAVAKDREIPLSGINLIEVVDALAGAILSVFGDEPRINCFTSLVGVAPANF
jgi:hypothetical protein